MVMSLWPPEQFDRQQWFNRIAIDHYEKIGNPKRIRDETRAIEEVWAFIAPLNHEARQRVLAFCMERARSDTIAPEEPSADPHL